MSASWTPPDPWVGWYAYATTTCRQTRELTWTSVATGPTWQECRKRTERAAPAGVILQVLLRGTHPADPVSRWALPVRAAEPDPERPARAARGAIPASILGAFQVGEWASPAVIMERLRLSHSHRANLYSVLSRLRRAGVLLKRKVPGRVEYARAEVVKA